MRSLGTKPGTARSGLRLLFYNEAQMIGNGLMYHSLKGCLHFNEQTLWYIELCLPSKIHVEEPPWLRECDLIWNRVFVDTVW